MKLVQFRITNFRSVEDSGWIAVDNVTAFIGVNESGKTNLLTPLWKLNPAREGELLATSDYPKTKFGEIRAAPEAYWFISADFDTSDICEKLQDLTGLGEEQLDIVRVRKNFKGEFEVSFPNYAGSVVVAAQRVSEILSGCSGDVSSLSPLKTEDALKKKILGQLETAQATLEASGDLDANGLKELIANVEALVPETPAKTSTIVPRLLQANEALKECLVELTKPSPESEDGVFEAVTEAIPKFVYYSNYGNLDSEIYLPHVVQNLSRKDLGAKEAAKARTLKVLFKFVRLSPQEILELGRDFKVNGREPTDAEISEIAEKKRERTILLQSADTTLTKRFREWWKQGDYRFEFQADGDHFRIWVSDDRRPERIELESRSTGLQWFLSFYLIFLVESEGEHQNSILLLDEPGLSLHPLAQRQLSAFFDGLAGGNQILYTTHSPFLVDADRLDRARKVYVADDGTTKATPDLRYGDSDKKQQGAAYAVHSALNMSVAESLLLGCMPVLVEGGADQHYLTTIKALLIGAKKISPKRELVFPPSGGAKTAKVVAGILTGRDEKLPVVVFDGDTIGKSAAKEMRATLYAAEQDKVLLITDFVEMESAEIEDLFPVEFLANLIDRLFRDATSVFQEVAEEGRPFVSQVEAWASDQKVTLTDGWKVELAIKAKQAALAKGISQFDTTVVERWVKLFSAMIKKADY